MTGRHDFCDLTKKFTPEKFTLERRERIEARVAELRAKVALRKLLDRRATIGKAFNNVIDASRPASASKET